MQCKSIPKFFKNIHRYYRIFVDAIIDILFSLCFGWRKKRLPDLDKRHSMLAESAVTLARKIRQKELKSEDLVRAVIERIKQVNPIINAICEDRFEAALLEAREVDQLIKAGLSDEEFSKKPFLGVPYTLKESQPVKGMKYTLGLWSRRTVIAQEDCEAVIRMRAAGAIPVATSNLPEMLSWQETRNPVYGVTRNPHHTGRTVGGSSGGEGALAASYASPINFCSDLGGSTRMPAFFCGMFGHHTTPGTTNYRGVTFRQGEEESMMSLGFITRHAEDIGPLTKILAGDKAPMLNFDKDYDMKNIKFYYMEEANDCNVSYIRPELKNAMQRAIKKIKQTVPPANAPKQYYHEGFHHMYALWNYCMSKEPESYPSLLADGRGTAGAIKELFKKMFCMSRHCLSSIFIILTLKSRQVSPAKAAWSEKLMEDLKKDIYTKLGDSGVLLLPSAPQPAPYHHSFLMRPYNFAYWCIVNALKCPATQVPMGRNSKGLPLGIQVVAAPGNDGLCVAVAKYLEKEFGGAVFPCRVLQ